MLCGKPKKPRGLDKVASRLWDGIVPKLSAAGIVSEVDGVCLGDMCRWYARYTESAKDWGDAQSSRLARAAWQEFASLASKFGMNPSDRARLRVAPKDTDDPLLKLMGPG